MLKAEGLTKKFGGLLAVDRATFEVGKPALTVVVGPNGAGKSTLFNLIGGLFPVSSGRLLLFGQDITDLPAYERVRRGIAKTFQLVSVFPQMSVREHVLLPRRKREGRAKGPGKTVEGILDRMGLLDKIDAPCARLTIGEKKRLELAMVLSLEPELLLLDEVFAGLTAHEVDQLKKAVLQLATEKAILLIEHRLDIVMEIARRVIVMVKGAVIAEGTPAEVRANTAVQKAYLREDR